MTALTDILRTLPAAGTRLPGGLALRITKGNGMAVLGVSRIDQEPSRKEMEVLAEAVAVVFDPRWIFRGAEPELIRSGGHAHYVWRLYWPAAESIELVYTRPRQVEMFLPAERPDAFEELASESLAAAVKPATAPPPDS